MVIGLLNSYVAYHTASEKKVKVRCWLTDAGMGFNTIDDCVIFVHELVDIIPEMKESLNCHCCLVSSFQVDVMSVYDE